MSGNPAFQGSPLAFEADAFQSGAILVGADYSLGSPVFVAPTLTYNYAFTATAYSLGSPVFATPTLATAAGITNLQANPYSLGSPSFTLPSLRIYQTLAVNTYSLGSPTFALPASGQNYNFFTNAMGLSSPSFDTPLLQHNFQLTAPVYSLGSPVFTQNVVLLINTTLTIPVDGYSLGSPTFGFPRLQWQDISPVFPMSYFTAADQASQILKQLMNYILMSVPPGITPATNNVRRLASTLRDNSDQVIRGTTLGTQLQQVYTAADAAGATYGGIEAARQYLMTQAASSSIFTQIVFQSALVMTLALESTIVSRMKFSNQADAQVMVLHMRDIFESAKAVGIDDVDAAVYQTLNALGGAIINHLAQTVLQLPRFVTWESKAPMPSLTLAQRIYADASRSDEIEAENAVIHPAFMPRTIRVLSDAPVGRTS